MEATDPLYCKPCQKQFTGWANIAEHNDSPAHKRTVAQQQQIEDMTKSLPALQQPDRDGHESLDEFMKTEDQNMYLCELCHCTCSGKIPALNHVRGKSHRQKKQNRQFSLNLSSAAPESYSATTNPPSSLPPSSLPPSSSDGPSVFQRNPVTGHFYCTVCKLSVSGEVPAKQHLQGKNHAKKVKILKGLTETDLSLSFSQMSLTTSVGNELTANSSVITQSEGSRWPIESVTQGKASDGPPSQPGNLEEDETLPGGDETDFQRSMDNNFDGDLEIVGATGQWHCKVCQVSLNSEKTIRQHFLGKAHQKKKKSASISLGDVGGPLSNRQPIHFDEVVFDSSTGQWECKICNVYLTSEIPVQEHISGKAHQKRKSSAQMEGYYSNTNYTSKTSGHPITTSSIVGTSNPNAEWTADVTESISLGSLPSHTTNSALLNRQPPGDPAPPLKGQVARVAWERSPRLDENLNPLNNASDRNGSFNTAAIAKNMTQPELHIQLGGYHGNRATIHEGLGYDPAVSTATSQYAPRNDHGMQQVDSPYWSLPHNSDTHNPVRTSNTVRPPPGFGPDVLPRNKPMSDFLMHQHNASTNPPSHMHRFWSMPTTETQDSSNFGQTSETPPSLKTNRDAMPPIGTPVTTAAVRVPEQPGLQSVVQEDIMNSFAVDRDPQKLLCKICNVFVTGRESAEAHLAGSKHAKKLRAFEFQKNHLEPQVTVQERPLHGDRESPHLQNNGYRSNNFSPANKASSFNHGPNSSGSFSSYSSSGSYDYNFSSGSSSSGSFDPSVRHHQAEGGASVDDRFYSLRGPSLGHEV